MKRAFTILELLVASLLLGMLVTILTMLFNQSSIAWRTGVAGVADLDDVRTNIADLRDDADNAYIWNNNVQRLLGLWDESGNLRRRAWDVEGNSSAKGTVISLKDDSKLSDIKTVPVGNGDSGSSIKTYSMNVKSAGPNRVFNDYDDIWSFPDEIN